MAELSPNKQTDIDFDYLMRLAKNDPEGFKTKRQEMIDQYINSVPQQQQHRLRCVQWRIDQTIARAKSPLSACMAITEMMWESFEQLNQLFLELNDDPLTNTQNDPMTQASADILPFRTA